MPESRPAPSTPEPALEPAPKPNRGPWPTVELAVREPLPSILGFAIKALAKALLELRGRIEKLEKLETPHPEFDPDPKYK